ncbi:odorant receptor 13a-like isoform X4 [Diachasmimorpha longicaudata]|uniref:odorant receptor 13a-like isoform X4 n=1 Tax=Diachasmimorpha longicaudata TaxID=58733 RepID=UPI0030B86F28
MIEYVANVNGGTFESAEDVIKILHPILRFGGLWPLDPPGFRYLFFLVPYIITKFFGFLDLIDVFGKLELTIENIAEETLVIVTVSRLLWVKFSPLLPNLISTVRDGMRAENFDSDEERRLYLEYNVTTKVVVKFVIAMGMAGTIAYHVRPLIFRMLASVQGQTNISYVLPYRAQVFFDYQDPRLYSLVYFLQSITIFIHFFVTATIGLLFMLCFHCCGELSALQHRIKAISFEAKNERHSPEFIVKDFVERHMKIIEIAKNIDKASQVVLLEELATMTIILALSSYCAMLVDKRWCTSTLSIIYAYCYIGEALITESDNVHQAYYTSRWYDFSEEYKKSLTICMVGSSRPLLLTAGGFYTYSKVSFTAILKSAAAYLSMLRNLAES